MPKNKAPISADGMKPHLAYRKSNPNKKPLKTNSSKNPENIIFRKISLIVISGFKDPNIELLIIMGSVQSNASPIPMKIPLFNPRCLSISFGLNNSKSDIVIGIRQMR